MLALATQALFAAAGTAAIGVTIATIRPYRARIFALLTTGQQFVGVVR